MHFNANILWNLELQYLILPGTKPFSTEQGSLIAM